MHKILGNQKRSSLVHIKLMVVFLVVAFTCSGIYADGALKSKHVFEGLPKAESDASQYKLLNRIGYSVGYSDKLANPLWSAYIVKGGADKEKGKRPARFKTDDETEAKVTHNDYKQSDYKTNKHAYDRGHMTPNLAIGLNYGEEAQMETFLMSNICPQEKFQNQQTWRGMESVIVRKYSMDFAKVWVIVGPIFESKDPKKLGKSVIPDAFFMILTDEAENEAGEKEICALAIIMKQDVKGPHRLSEFVTTIDEIEAKTKLDFFPKLPDDVEEKLEKSLADPAWWQTEFLSIGESGSKGWEMKLKVKESGE